MTSLDDKPLLKIKTLLKIVNYSALTLNCQCIYFSMLPFHHRHIHLPDFHNNFESVAWTLMDRVGIE